MPHPLFAFRLRPLEDIAPWSGPEGPHVNWFGLTDGWFWINTGDALLSEDQADNGEGTPWGSVCEYQVARLFDDITELAPFVLSEVPQPLHAFFKREAGRSWHDFRDAWWKHAIESPATAGSRLLLHAASEMRRLRTLDTGYIVSSSQTLMWSFEGEVHLEWENRGDVPGGTLIPSVLRGALCLPRERFIAELRGFCGRLCDAMEERIRQVESSGVAPGIRIDVAALAEEQARRRRQLDHELANPRYPYDWATVIETIEKLVATKPASGNQRQA